MKKFGMKRFSIRQDPKKQVTFSVTVYENAAGGLSIYSDPMQYESTSVNVGRDLLLLLNEWIDMVECDYQFLDQ